MDLFTTLGTLIKEAGPWVALCAFFVWGSWRREERMAKRLDVLGDRDSQRQEQMAQALRGNTAALKTLCEVLKQRPCLVDDEVNPYRQQRDHAQRTPLPDITSDSTPPKGHRAISAGLLLLSFLALAGCSGGKPNVITDKRPVPAAEAPMRPTQPSRLDAARAKRDAVDGSALDRLIAERDVLIEEKKEAEKVAALKSAELASIDSAIREERTRRAQFYVYGFAGVMVLAALVCIGLAVWIPLLRRRMLVGAVACLAVGGCAVLFAALLPYFLVIGCAVLVVAIAVVVLDLKTEHKLSQQMARAVNRIKERVPDYRGVFREEIDSDADARMDAHRRLIGDTTVEKP